MGWDAIHPAPREQMTRYNGRRWRMCVYEVQPREGLTWGGFVEDSRHYLGSTGPCRSRRAALIEAAKIIAKEA